MFLSDAARALIEVGAAAAGNPMQGRPHGLDALLQSVELVQLRLRQSAPPRAGRRLLRKAEQQIADLVEREADAFRERDQGQALDGVGAVDAVASRAAA